MQSRLTIFVKCPWPGLWHIGSSILSRGVLGMPCVRDLAPCSRQWSHREVLGTYRVVLKVRQQSPILTSSYIINPFPLLIDHSFSLWAFVTFNLVFQLLMCVSKFPSWTIGFWRRETKSDLTLYPPQNLLECWYGVWINPYQRIGMYQGK